MEKVNGIILASALISLFMMVQAGMIACDVYDYAREKVKGPRGTS